jgi:hypothetical protein
MPGRVLLASPFCRRPQSPNSRATTANTILIATGTVATGAIRTYR